MPKRKLITRFIGLKEYRQNLSKLIDEAHKKNIHFVVMRHSKIVAHVTPPTKKGTALDELAQEVAEARKDFQEGNYFTQEEIEEMLGLA